MAQMGTRLRALAAATYAGTGVGGGGAVGSGAAARAAAGDATPVRTAGAELVAAGVDDVAAVSPAALSPLSPPMAWRRSRERFRRCSGISVIAGPR